MQRPAERKSIRDVTYRVEATIHTYTMEPRVYTSKRESIRVARRLLKKQAFGNASSVTMIERGYPPFARKPKTTLIFQAHVAKRRNGSLYVRTDEL